MAAGERPQERLEAKGPTALADTELLAMILRSGSKDRDVLAVAANLIGEAGSLHGLLRWSVDDFMAVRGVGKVKALQLITVMEIARRVLSQNSEDSTFDSPSKVFDYMLPVAAGLDVEKFWVLCLNRKNRLLRRAEVTSGTAIQSLAHPREVFREAIRTSATAIIAVHNHPTGDPAPSSADIQVTRKLRGAAELVGIDMLDHIIVGHPGGDPKGVGYYSFSESGVVL